MKKKTFLKIMAAAVCVVAFFANVSINENNATENTGLLTIGESAKAECNEGIAVPLGRCNGTQTRCYYDIDNLTCDPNS